MCLREAFIDTTKRYGEAVRTKRQMDWEEEEKKLERSIEDEITEWYVKADREGRNTGD